MDTGIVTDGDRNGILDLLADSAADETDPKQIFVPDKVSFNEVHHDLEKKPFDSRFADIFAPWFTKKNFPPQDQSTAEKILRDILAVKGKQLDYADLDELKSDVQKRMRTSQLLKESQEKNEAGELKAFDYPENMKAEHGCPGFVGPFNANNARVNKAAQAFWLGPFFDPKFSYYFTLSPAGRQNAFEALVALFTPQPTICDKTLIHCDYLVNVVEFRVYAESLGETKFNQLVKAGKISMWLTYTGFPKPGVPDLGTSPKGGIT
jgi:hypothetical protein